MAEQTNPTRDWYIASTHHRTHKGTALDFARHPFQVGILQDKAQHKVIEKATQCGVSELEIDHAMSLLDQGRNVFWVFPDERLRNQMVKDRIDPSISNTPHYLMLVARAGQRSRRGKDASDDVTIKQLGVASLALVGSNSESSFKSFSADDAIIDELDQCDARNLAMVPDRFAHSQYRTTWKVGNPTISGYGIDALYAESDRKHWFIACEHCGERQPLDWFVNVAREISEGTFEPRASGARPSGLGCLATNPPPTACDDLSALCRKCERPLNRLASGEWVAEYPDRSISGYQINQIFSGSVPLSEMWDAFVRGLGNETERMRFYNSVLGLPYESTGAKLSEAILDRCVEESFPQESTGEGCFAGIDVGSLNHVIVLDGDRVLRIQAVHSFAELDEVMSAFGVRCAVIDAMPETRMAREFAERWQGRVLLCTFVKSDQVKDFAVDYGAATIKADRTQTLDESHAALLAGAIALPRDAASVPDFYAQMIAPTRVFDQERQVFRWVEGSQADHYRHALNYAWLARNVHQRTGGQTVWVA